MRARLGGLAAVQHQAKRFRMENLPRRGSSSAARPAGSRPTAREQVSLALLTVERARPRGARPHAPLAAAALALPVRRRPTSCCWRRPTCASPTPSFADEVASGSFGLAGWAATLARHARRSPSRRRARMGARAARLRLAAPSRRSAQTQDARDARPQLVARMDPAQPPARRRPPGRPTSSRRRVISWLSHAGLLLDGADDRRYGAVMRSLADQATHLSASWRNAPDGYPRLLCLIALVYADLCIAGHERQLAQSEKLLAAELERQILPDGGHLSRNPAVLIELLLDLLPLRQCLRGARQPRRRPRPALLGGHRAHDGDAAPPAARRRHARALQRHGRDRARRARHRAGLRRAARRATARPRRLRAPRARATVVIVDAGAAPPLELAGQACAGCLSFEMSTGRELLLVNAGMPGAREASRRAVARATASHNTLCLGEQSSARLMRDARLERMLGAPPLAPSRPCHVRGEREGGRRHRGRGLARRLRRALRPRPHAQAHARCDGLPARGPRPRSTPPRASCASPGTCRSRSISICIRRRRRASGPRRDTVAARARQRRALAPDGHGRRPVDRGEHATLPMPRGRCATQSGRAAGAMLRRSRGELGARAHQSGQSGSRRKQQAARPLAERLAETSAGFEPGRQ